MYKAYEIGNCGLELIEITWGWGWSIADRFIGRCRCVRHASRCANSRNTSKESYKDWGRPSVDMRGRERGRNTFVASPRLPRFAVAAAAVILTTWQPLCRPHACKPRSKREVLFGNAEYKKRPRAPEPSVSLLTRYFLLLLLLLRLASIPLLFASCRFSLPVSLLIVTE